MLDPSDVPAVSDDELLARFVVSKRQVAVTTGRVKPEAFLPSPKSGETSVTRHLETSEDELWSEGKRISAIRMKTLYGRADVLAKTCVAQDLIVQASPLAANPNHADLINWPMEDKPRQKIIAMEIATAAKFVVAAADEST